MVEHSVETVDTDENCLFRSLGVLLDKEHINPVAYLMVSEMASSLLHSQYFLVSQMDLCRVLLLLILWHVSLSHGDCQVPSFRFKESKGCVCILPCKIQMTMENAYARILSLLNSMIFHSIL